MSDGIDKLLAYRTMRAVQKMAEPAVEPDESDNPDESGSVQTEPRPSLWQRWQAAVYRIGDKLLG